MKLAISLIALALTLPAVAGATPLRFDFTGTVTSANGIWDNSPRLGGYLGNVDLKVVSMRFLSIALLIALAGAASAVEVIDAELIPSGSSMLQNGSDTIRIEDSRLGRLAPPVFVPEPGALLQGCSAIGALALFAVYRRFRSGCDAPAGPSVERTEHLTELFAHRKEGISP